MRRFVMLLILLALGPAAADTPELEGFWWPARGAGGARMTELTAQRSAEALWTELGVTRGDLSGLQSVPFTAIVDNQTNAGPVLYGDIVPRDPFAPDAPAISAAVPMIIGTTLEDFGFTITDTEDDDESIKAWLRNQLPESASPAQADELFTLYRESRPEKSGFVLRAIAVCRIHAPTKAAAIPTQLRKRPAPRLRPCYHLAGNS